MFSKPTGEVRRSAKEIANHMDPIKTNKSAAYLSEAVSKTNAKKAERLVESKPVLDIPITPTMEKQRKRELITESIKKYTDEFFVNALADVVIESFILDTAFVQKNYQDIKVETVNRLNTLMENGVFDPTKSGNQVIRDMLNASAEHAKYITEEYFNGEKSDEVLDEEQRSLYEGFKEAVILESLQGQKVIRDVVTSVITAEIARAEKVTALTEEVAEDSVVEEAGGTKVSALKLRNLAKISAPSYYQTINNIVNEQYVEEHGDPSQFTEKDMDNILAETIKLYTLNEALNVFKLIEFDRTKVNQTTKRMASLFK